MIHCVHKLVHMKRDRARAQAKKKTHSLIGSYLNYHLSLLPFKKNISVFVGIERALENDN